MDNKQHLKSLYSENCLGKFEISKDKEIKCYTKKQVYSLNPKKMCKFIGEYRCENLKDERDCIGDISVDDLSLPINKYRFNNRIKYSEKGYLQCDENTFVVLLKNVLLRRVLIFILCIFLISGAGFILFSPSNVSQDIRDMLNIDPNIIDWSENDPPQEKTADSTKIPGFASMTIPANTTAINLSLGNPAENKCYFITSIILEDGTELFKSELIPPGKGFSTINLSKPLSSGEYNAILKYQTFSLDTQREMNGANLNIKIIVQ